LGELCQLAAADVRLDGEMPLLVLTDDGEGQSIKSEAGKRSIPIHSELVRLGFLDYARAVQQTRSTSLWPGLPLREGKPSDFFGRWFRKQRAAVGLPAGYPDFHCFRHTVRPLMRRAGFAESTLDKITGHLTRGSTGTETYDHWTLQEIQAAGEAIKYPKLKLPKVARKRHQKAP
jgi:hypothetical protein